MLQNCVGLTDHFLFTPRKLKRNRSRSDGRNHGIRFFFLNKLCGERRMAANLHTGPFHQPPKGDGCLLHLRFSRSLARRDKLTSQTVARLKDNRLVPSLMKHPGRLQSGHSSACDINPFRCLRLRKLPLLLMPQARISQTCDKRPVP